MILIALGGNLPWRGDPPETTILRALARLDALDAASVASRSGLWRSPAWPDPSDPPYVNAAARLESALGPEALLARLLEVERAFGRERAGQGARNAPRTLDIDLIDHDGARIRSADLTLPHPRAHERAFVLAPALDVAPNWTLPGLGPARDLYAALPAADRAALERLPIGPSQAHKRP